MSRRRVLPSQREDWSSLPLEVQRAGYLSRTCGPTLSMFDGTTDAMPNKAVCYLSNFSPLGGSPSLANAFQLNADSSIKITGLGGLSSASATGDAKDFRGIAFGGGAYFEAEFAYEGWQGSHADPLRFVNGWPAWWGMAIEHLASYINDQWPGQIAGYTWFIEFDFFEGFFANQPGHNFSDDVYAGSLIGWYGSYGVPTPFTFSHIDNDYEEKFRYTPASTNFSQFHKYGALWVPASDASSGYFEWYFDGVKLGARTSYRKIIPANLAAPPVGTDAFAVADSQHIAWIISSPGALFPMTIKSINVWQRNGDLNQFKRGMVESYTRSVLATDNFNRANGSEGANWLVAFGGPLNTIANNQVTGVGSSYHVQALGTNQYVRARYRGNTAASSSGWYLITRMASGGATGVIIAIEPNSNYRILRYGGGDATLKDYTQLNTPLVDGDVFELRAVIELVAGVSKTLITAMQNGVSLTTVVDTTQAGDYAGKGIYGTGGAPILDDFECGNLVAA